MQKKKILITGGESMLAYDFIRTQAERYDIIPVGRNECDITAFESIIQCISEYEPDILLNCAAYTAVDDAEDIGMKLCYDVNTLGVYNLARATSVFGVEFITISTDYVFDGTKSEGYFPSDPPNPIGAYGMSKYLGEKLAIQENPRVLIVRTSWLYGGNYYGSKDGVFKNFVNTMLKLSEIKTELKIVTDQHGIPTSCIDLSNALATLIDRVEEQQEVVDNIFHFSNTCEEGNITWADFAREIFQITGKNIEIINCTSDEYLTKAKRPQWSILKNDGDILLLHWKEGLARYLGK